MSRFKANTTKQTVYGRGQKLSNPKTEKQPGDNIIKSIRNLFILKKGNKETKDKLIKDFMTIFEQEHDYYQPKRVSNFRNDNYIEYEIKGDRNKNLSLKKYLDKIKRLKQLIFKNLIHAKFC